MSQLIVYRVQDRDGRGPWKPGFSSKWVEDRTDAEFDALVPWVMEFRDILSARTAKLHLGCGCVTLEQLRRWFMKNEYATLLRYGYRAVRMEVDRVLGASDIQCVFERAKPLREDVVGIELYES